MLGTHDVAWAAGLFDGEGSFMTTKDGHPRASITQVDREVLDRFKEVVGEGKVYGPYHRTDKSRPNSKDAHMYVVSGFAQVNRVGGLLINFLGSVKRDQFNKVIDAALERSDRKGFH